MNRKYTFIILISAGLILSACSNDDDAGNAGAGAGGTTPEIPATPTLENALAIYGRQAADDEPLPISAQLDTDIQTVFGDADNSPTDVVDGDSVQSVIDRAEIN